MEAVEFIRTLQKLCEGKGCDDCPLHDIDICDVRYVEDPEEMVRIVEEWAAEQERKKTEQEQQNNKRSNHIVYLGEIGHTISEWSEILGIGKTTIRMRLESGWSDENALTVPVRKRTRGYRP